MTDVTDTLAAALVAAQKNMPPVDKTAKANYGTYATLDHIIAKTRPVLNKHGLSIVQFPEATELGAPGLRTTITHVSGESLTALMPLFLVKQDMQSFGSALTYARRYAWAAALGISTEADDDGALATRPNASGDEPVKAAQDSPQSGTASVTQPAEAASSPPDEPVMISFDQRGKIAQLVPAAAKANKTTGTKLSAALTEQYGPFEELTAAAADELIGKLHRWIENAGKAAEAAA